MSQINVNKVISPTQAASNGPSIEVASNGNMSIESNNFELSVSVIIATPSISSTSRLCSFLK